MAKIGNTPPPSLVVADDEEGLLFLMTDALRREGFEVQGFASGNETLAWLTDHSADLLLLDLKLGDLPAPDLVERLRKRGRKFPFIIVTGHGDERTAADVMKQGALDYVMKDSGMLELLPSIVRRTLVVVERERKLAEADAVIRQTQERHEQVIHTALDGFVRFHRNGHLLEVNTAFCELVGCKPEDLLEKDVFDTKAVGLREEVRKVLEPLDSNGAARCFTRLNRRDGSEIEVEISIRREGDEFFGFIHDISEQRRLEREILQTTLEERRRLGHELHDGLGQQLTALEIMTHTVARELKSLAPKQAKAVLAINEYIRRTVTQTREIAHGLSPVPAGDDGLMKALQELALMTTSTGVTCEFHCEDPVRIADGATAAHLHRIAQEAVTNALRHAAATKIDLRLEDSGNTMVLIVEDDGKGLRRSKTKQEGIGLQVIQHRARLIGAELVFEPGRSKGVKIICSLPKPS